MCGFFTAQMLLVVMLSNAHEGPETSHPALSSDVRCGRNLNVLSYVTER